HVELGVRNVGKAVVKQRASVCGMLIGRHIASLHDRPNLHGDNSGSASPFVRGRRWLRALTSALSGARPAAPRLRAADRAAADATAEARAGDMLPMSAATPIWPNLWNRGPLACLGQPPPPTNILPASRFTVKVWPSAACAGQASLVGSSGIGVRDARGDDRHEWSH
ncbi:MAG TPA: hypothetical protein VGP67_15400, partial [Gaiellales bacterium]|nr:hypothetical protein [Gaiellales bacterium]